MQIAVRQISGLGNQMFQYAAGLYYARRHGAAMRIAVDAAKRAWSHGHPRPFLLSRFAIEAPWGELTARDRFLLSERKAVQPISVPLRRALGVYEFTELVEQRYRFLEDLPLPSASRLVYLAGYWQTYRLVEAVADQLRLEFRFREEASGKTAQVLEQIRSSAHPVSLHIRRGDYTLAAEGQRALPLGYYAEAIALMRAKLTTPTFFVFSDDIAYAKAHLPSGIQKVFVDHNDDYSSHEDLRLMSCCSHHIIANSSFSWWGAWLNGASDKLVAAPRHWYLDRDSYYPDLLPPGWTLLDTTRTP